MSTGNSLPERNFPVVPDVQEWAPASDTSIARLSYHLDKLPSIWLFKAKIFQYKEKDGVWKYVYSRRRRESLWKRVLNGKELKSMKEILAVDTRTTSRAHQDHVIIRFDGLNEDQRAGLARDPTTLYKVPTDLQRTEGDVCCLFGHLCELDEDHDADSSLYHKGVDLLVQSRIASLSGAGPCDLSKTHAMFIPIVGFEDRRIMPLAKGCKDTSKTASGYYDVKLRTQVSLDVPQKLLYIEFDLAAMVPINEPIPTLLFQVFGSGVSENSIKTLLPHIQNLLEGIWVRRNYEPPADINQEAKDAFHDPFQIRSLRFNKDVTEEKVDRLTNAHMPEYKDKSWTALPAMEGYDTNKYHEKRYNDGKPLSYSYMPLAGDRTYKYFPLEKLVTVRNLVLEGVARATHSILSLSIAS